MRLRSPLRIITGIELVLQCNNLTNPKVQFPTDLNTMLCALEFADCRKSLRFLDIQTSTVSQDDYFELPKDSPVSWHRDNPLRLEVPRLENLRVCTGRSGIKFIMESLARGNSMSQMIALELVGEVDLDMIDIDVGGDSSGRGKPRARSAMGPFQGLRHLAVKGRLSPSVITAIADGWFGVEITNLDFGFYGYRHKERDGLPNGLSFRLPHLQSLTLAGWFNSKAVNGFGDVESCPRLEKITCHFQEDYWGNTDLKHFSFPIFFLERMISWNIDERVYTNSTKPWAYFRKLASTAQFRPMILTGTPFPRVPYIHYMSCSEQPAWDCICEMPSVEEIRTLSVWTRDILNHGWPQSVKTADVCLVPTGLTEHEVGRVVEVLRQVEDGKFAASLDFEANREEYEIDMELQGEEEQIWDRLAREGCGIDLVGFGSKEWNKRQGICSR